MHHWAVGQIRRDKLREALEVCLVTPTYVKHIRPVGIKVRRFFGDRIETYFSEKPHGEILVFPLENKIF
jgi:hypothetical protein